MVTTDAQMRREQRRDKGSPGVTPSRGLPPRPSPPDFHPASSTPRLPGSTRGQPRVAGRSLYRGDGGGKGGGGNEGEGLVGLG